MVSTASLRLTCNRSRKRDILLKWIVWLKWRIWQTHRAVESSESRLCRINGEFMKLACTSVCYLPNMHDSSPSWQYVKKFIGMPFLVLKESSSISTIRIPFCTKHSSRRIVFSLPVPCSKALWVSPMTRCRVPLTSTKHKNIEIIIDSLIVTKLMKNQEKKKKTNVEGVIES